MSPPNSKNDRLLTGMIIGVSVLGIGYFGWRAISENANTARENPFEYTVEDFREIDPALLRYTEVRTIPLDMETVHGLAVDDSGRVYVTGDDRVLVMNGEGREQAVIPTGGTARCIGVDTNGDMYLGMTGGIEVYGREGVRKARWNGPGGHAVLTSVAVTDNYVYVADAGNRILRKYDKSGNEVLRIGGRDESRGIPGSIVPSPFYDTALDPDGFVWLTNPGRHTLENYTPEGDPRTSWGLFSMDIGGFCGCCNPGHLAILDDGRFVTSEKGIPRVKVYDRLGKLESVVAGPDRFAEGTEGLDLAVDSRGRVYVLDPARKAVRIFERKNPGV